MNTPSHRPARTPMPALTVLSFVLLASPAAAQEAPDWCADARNADHCEVRELSVETRAGHLTVDATPNGGIRVESWDRDHVAVLARVTTRGRSRGAAEDVASRVEVRAEPGRIASTGPRSLWRQSWQVSYRIQVPVGTHLDLRSTNGGIDVRGVAGPVDARTTNGGIRLEDVSGSVRARSSNGGVHASFPRNGRLEGDSELRTSNGSVTVRLPDGVSARLEASTTNGSIDTDFPLTVEGRVGRSVSADLGAGGPEIRLRTTNGPIRIRRH